MAFISIQLGKGKKQKKKTEFSKKWLVSCIVISVIFTAASYVLSIFDKQPLETLSAEILGTLWGASGVSFVGYALQNSARAFTASKFGIPDTEKKEGGGNDGI